MKHYRKIFRDNLSKGHLFLQYCPTCRRFIFYPREFCPYCWGSDLEWRETQGQGTVYSYTIVYVSALPEFEPPYIYALVDLAEGFRIAANIENCSLDEIRVGMPVKLAFKPREGIATLPIFKPI